MATPVEAELEVTRSRFRCLLTRVEHEPDARSVVDGVRKQHWDARHHCSAFLIGPAPALERSSDDGEPAGTAGAPMLDVLRGAGLSDVVAVVTRWFGGVLLGTGGLARAYGDAVRAAVAAAEVIDRRLFEVCTVTVEHSDLGRLQHDLRIHGVTVLDVEYADRAVLRLAVPPGHSPMVGAMVAASTGGRATATRVGEQWRDG